MRVIHLLAPLILLAGLAACGSTRAQRRPYLILENLDYAQRHLRMGQCEEAAQIFQTVLIADPANATARDGMAQLAGCDTSMLMPSLLGKNLKRGVRCSEPIGWVVLYPVNRILDVLDAVTVHVGLEGGVYAQAHVTYAMQVGLGAAGGMQLGWWQKRELAVGAGHATGLGIGPFSLEGEGATRVGTRGATGWAFSMAGLNRPSDYVYQRHRDYWSVGARATVLLVGAEVEVHPVELADAIASLFFLDLLHDDLGHTRPLDLEAYEIEAMEDLIGTLEPWELRARMRGRAIPPPSGCPAAPEDADAPAPEPPPSAGPAAESPAP